MSIVRRFNKLVKAVPFKGHSAAEVPKSFVNSYVFNYRTPKEFITDNRKCFLSKFFQSICQVVGTQNAFTTTCNTPKNVQVEKYNRIILSAMHRNVADHLKNWEMYRDALMYAYNCQLETTTSIETFELSYRNNPVHFH